MKFDEMIDREQTVDVAKTSENWKQRIVSYLYDQPEFTASVEDVLQATDPRYTGENKNKRIHCLASQLTYLRQDLGVETYRPEADKIALLGVRDPETGNVHPFVKK